MDSLPILACTPSAYWPLILTYVLPPAGALLSGIALWVAARARGISADAEQTSAAAVALSLLQSEPPVPNGYPPGAQDRRKH
jgi:endonuclease/exonuclease/phosphatase (EEP) superfamily protein YafD